MKLPTKRLKYDPQLKIFCDLWVDFFRWNYYRSAHAVPNAHPSPFFVFREGSFCHKVGFAVRESS